MNKQGKLIGVEIGNAERIERQGETLKNSVEDRLFVPKMTVDRASGHPGRIGDFVQGGLRDAMTGISMPCDTAAAS